MPSSHEDDFDWLYGRERAKRVEPHPAEPTKVLPSAPGPTVAGGSPGPQGRPSAYPASPASGYRSMPGPGDRRGGPPYPPRKRRSGVRRFFLILLLVLVLWIVALVAIPIYAWSQIERVDDVPPGKRPADQPGKTFLLVGSDSREGLSKAEQKKLGTGSTAGRRTDTIMILFVPRSGKPALISVPRDSYVSIPDKGENKVNAAYSFGGPDLLVATIEQNTNLRIDGYMEIGFGGFVSIVDSVGGVEMCLPKAIKDRDSHLNLPKGCQTLDGINALGYVRMRKADPKGDLGRVERQRAVLGAVAKEAATPATVLNPVRYWRVTTSGAEAVRLGIDTTFLETVTLANAMRKVAGGNGLTLTVPVADPDASTPIGSAVVWDTDQAKAVFADIARGDTSELSKYAK
jgi:LCP family protein required for cell wall assembly